MKIKNKTINKILKILKIKRNIKFQITTKFWVNNKKIKKKFKFLK